jgi:phytoene dehydrogenase-like protein
MNLKFDDGDSRVLIVGAGLSGLACANRLMKANVPFQILEANDHIGGRLRSEKVAGFMLNFGFQVLQTAYPEARKVLDFQRLELKNFAPGAMIHIEGKFYRVVDPRRYPRYFFATLKAPVGTFADRLRILRLALKVRRMSVTDIFNSPDMPTQNFLRKEGFSEKMIHRFFKPFFSGVCLDPEIKFSSRVFRYIFSVFAAGDVSLPSRGMGAICDQLAEELPGEKILLGSRVQAIKEGNILLASGKTFRAPTVVLATEAPETARLLGLPEKIRSRGELCLYFTAAKPPIAEPYIILNGDGKGFVNSVTVPSIVAPTYAPVGHALISVVVIGDLSMENAAAEARVRQELTGWFGAGVKEWRHIKTYRIAHALPDQLPPVTDPSQPPKPSRQGIFVCGEYNSVPGIQWALRTGRKVAEQVLKER